jgi:hypothetical protein
MLDLKREGKWIKSEAVNIFYGDILCMYLSISRDREIFVAEKNDLCKESMEDLRYKKEDKQ